MASFERYDRSLMTTHLLVEASSSFFPLIFYVGIESI